MMKLLTYFRSSSLVSINQWRSWNKRWNTKCKQISFSTTTSPYLNREGPALKGRREPKDQLERKEKRDLRGHRVTQGSRAQQASMGSRGLLEPKVTLEQWARKVTRGFKVLQGQRARWAPRVYVDRRERRDRQGREDMWLARTVLVSVSCLCSFSSTVFLHIEGSRPEWYISNTCIYRGFPTRMEYLCNDNRYIVEIYHSGRKPSLSCLRYTILVGNTRYVTLPAGSFIAILFSKGVKTDIRN